MAAFTFTFAFDTIIPYVQLISYCRFWYIISDKCKYKCLLNINVFKWYQQRCNGYDSKQESKNKTWYKQKTQYSILKMKSFRYFSFKYNVTEMRDESVSRKVYWSYRLESWNSTACHDIAACPFNIYMHSINKMMDSCMPAGINCHKIKVVFKNQQETLGNHMLATLAFLKAICLGFLWLTPKLIRSTRILCS